MTDVRPLDPTPGGGTNSGAKQTEAPIGAAHAAKEESTQVAATAAEQGKQTVSAAAHAAGDTAGTAVEGAKQVASEAAQQVTEVTRQATEQARELMDQAQTQLREQAATQTQRAASGLSDVSRQFRALGDGETEKAGFAADGAKQIADKIEELANRLERRGFDGALEDLTSFARRRPGAFLLSSAAAGFVVTRLGRGMQAVKEPSDSGSVATGAGPGAPSLPPVIAQVPPPVAFGAPAPYLPPAKVPGADGGL